MKTFVVMSKLSPQGPSLVEIASKMQNLEESGRIWVDLVKESCPEVRFLAHYALLGPYDFMDIYEAPDEESAAKVSLICAADHMFTVESWTAIPDKRLGILIGSLRNRLSRKEDRVATAPRGDRADW